MLRKQVIKPPPETPAPMPGEIDIAATATVQVTSESTEHPVDYAFDNQRGPGGTRWVAGAPGEQAVILAFDAPQPIRRTTSRPSSSARRVLRIIAESLYTKDFPGR